MTRRTAPDLRRCRARSRSPSTPRRPIRFDGRRIVSTSFEMTKNKGTLPRLVPSLVPGKH
jgi:hypothetical protein